VVADHSPLHCRDCYALHAGGRSRGGERVHHDGDRRTALGFGFEFGDEPEGTEGR
jgi:hypothetical protein